MYSCTYVSPPLSSLDYLELANTTRSTPLPKIVVGSRGITTTLWSSAEDCVSAPEQDQTGRQYVISLTLPASYWYLRGFNLNGLETRGM